MRAGPPIAACRSHEPATHRTPCAPASRDLHVAILSLLALSCDPLGTSHSFEDEGQICLYPAGTPGQSRLQSEPFSYPANRGIDIVVTAPDCLSSSCSHDEQATCTATMEGDDVIRVRSRASYREAGSICSADCRSLSATCSTGPLPPGTYQVRHGDSTFALTVPSTVEPPCAGKAPFSL